MKLSSSAVVCRGSSMLMLNIYVSLLDSPLICSASNTASELGNLSTSWMKLVDGDSWSRTICKIQQLFSKKASIDYSKAKLFAIIFSNSQLNNNVLLCRTWLTLLFVREVAGISSRTTESFVGTDPSDKYLAFGFSSSGTSMWYRVPKQDFSKCAEHTDEFVGVKFGRCFRTNFIHIFRCSSFAGNLCIDSPSTWFVFVQLRNPGPLQTQNFPLFALFMLEANACWIRNA